MPNKRQNKSIIILFIFIGAGLAALYVAPQILPGVIISGYDGIVAEVVEIESDYNLPEDEIDISGTSADIDPIWRGAFQPDPTGLKIEVQAGVNIGESELLQSVDPQVIDNGDGTFTHKSWDIQKVKCTTGASVKTFGGGLDPIEDVTFWVQLSENDFSVFSSADEQFAYILNVYTLSKAETTAGVDAIPESGGYDFPITSVTTVQVPQWLIDSGYQTGVSKLAVVKFPIKILKMQPEILPVLQRGAEAQYDIEIGVDVFLAGYWEEVKDSREFDPPDPEKTFWDNFLEMSEAMGGPLALIAIIVIGIVAIVIIIKLMAASVAGSITAKAVRV